MELLKVDRALLKNPIKQQEVILALCAAVGTLQEERDCKKVMQKKRKK